MSSEKHELQLMKNVSFDVQFSWMIGRLAQILKTSKKQLRKAKGILDQPKFEDTIKGKEVTFYYGFHGFVSKKKGKHRKILAPHPEIQKVFRTIKDWLDKMNQPHENAFGFIKKRNIQMATQSLLGNKHYFSFDVANAFPSIVAEMVEKKIEDLGLIEELAQLLAWLVTYHYNEQRRLPQGSSSSPNLLNLVYGPIHQEIDEICKEHNIEWFVYADDFNFAGPTITAKLKRELLAVPVKYGFTIKEEKNRDNLGKTIPHILGLTIVNKEIHIRRRNKKTYRRIFYMAWKYGVYSPAKVQGTAATIRQTYGNEKNWPGSLRKYWVLYQAQAKGGK